MKRNDYSIRVWTRGKTWHATIKTRTTTTVLWCRSATFREAMEQAIEWFWRNTK
jgi:hypothetical protein